MGQNYSVYKNVYCNIKVIFFIKSLGILDNVELYKDMMSELQHPGLIFNFP